MDESAYREADEKEKDKLDIVRKFIIYYNANHMRRILTQEEVQMECIFYKKVIQDPIIHKMIQLNDYRSTNPTEEIISEIIDETYAIGLGGDLFKSLLCYKIITDENVFSLSAEKKGQEMNQTYKNLALQDIARLKELFHMNIMELKIEEEPVTYKEVYEVFENNKSNEEILETLIHFYHVFGAGMMNCYSAFKWHTQGYLMGIKNCDTIQLEDLVGCTYQKEMLIKNTENFLQGKQANHALLFGDAGTTTFTSFELLIFITFPYFSTNYLTLC